MNRVPVQPNLLRWARERAGYRADALTGRFPKLEDWERGEVCPTFKQLEAFAKAIHTPVGFLFLAEPPVERVPIPDFRTVGNVHVGYPSPDLLDTVYLCQQRQDWYRDFARSMHEPALSFIGSARVGNDIVETATTMRHSLGFDLEERRRLATWTDALRRFIEQAEGLGVLVMVSGVVGSNNRRRLDPQEFRGFALADPLAPLVFVNGADTKAAQICNFLEATQPRLWAEMRTLYGDRLEKLLLASLVKDLDLEGTRMCCGMGSSSTARSSGSPPSSLRMVSMARCCRAPHSRLSTRLARANPAGRGAAD